LRSRLGTNERRADPGADKITATIFDYFDFIFREWQGAAGPAVEQKALANLVLATRS